MNIEAMGRVAFQEYTRQFKPEQWEALSKVEKDKWMRVANEVADNLLGCNWIVCAGCGHDVLAVYKEKDLLGTPKQCSKCGSMGKDHLPDYDNPNEECEECWRKPDRVTEDDLAFHQTRTVSPQWIIKVHNEQIAIVTERYVAEPPFNIRWNDDSDEPAKDREEVVDKILAKINKKQVEKIDDEQDD
jgi:hypothetical protein